MRPTPLKVARISKGITVEEMARKLQMSISYYYKIEQGARIPNIYIAKRIAELLDGTIDELFFGNHLDVTSKMLLPTGTERR
ncbi:helix-turn-helix transcriptional regulator [Kroppenstedtia sanguinis]|uniref:Helix-turn-helix transcriptional regulator n=1 Tax=Kroppenstedtia sanguinis TaxID=1380684 RepID=A0ABW4C438_9BACL